MMPTIVNTADQIIGPVNLVQEAGEFPGNFFLTSPGLVAGAGGGDTGDLFSLDELMISKKYGFTVYAQILSKLQ